MDTVQSMRVFARVAQRSGFAAAARDLQMSTAAVTKHVAALEARIRARLLNRTTRRVALTEAGRVYLERCLECLQAFEVADASVGELSSAPRGLLRVTAPVEYGNMHLAPVIARFIDRYPEIVVDLRLSNRMLDLVEEGIDLGIRFATSLDASYVARPLASTRAVCWAAPSYLRRHGRPRRPEELAKHACLVFSEPAPRDELEFQRGDEKTRVKLRTVLLTNSGEALCAAARLGAGVALMPSMLSAGEYAAGRLEPILLDWSLFTGRLYAVYPHRRFVTPNVRAFLEALRAEYGDDPARDPWWPRELDRPKHRRRASG
ncbi:MAG TPA: LysR family transcriptional regulator [Polyangia bacterium]|nr:LysR family transcriptional regulator [Polyangia bacterium]